MNTEQSRWAQRYRTALNGCLRRGSATPRAAALQLGRDAAVLRMEPLEVARCHEQALTADKRSDFSESDLRRAAGFFAKVVSAIERAYPPAADAQREVRRLTLLLDRETNSLGASRQRLKLGVAQRRKAGVALHSRAMHGEQLLRESRRLQQELKRVSHRILASQELERKKASRNLHNEIAQHLLGIHVRLLAMKGGVATRARTMKKEVASTQQLVKNSGRLAGRLRDENGATHEA